ncbi:tetratricopeptide repeat protein [Aegicerativicinus sediminis]|uniref:tetratricopeptide repeat protein n=1 Tax=Aegicerativicinus sediminis TaxID=2893202 RepID=UPI001E433FB4|nr:hypothetical protein [Aegicerativicinus sediminis]
MKLYPLFAFLAIILISCKSNEKESQPTIETPPEPSLGCVPAVTDAEWYKIDNKAPLLDGMDVIEYPITTNDTLAQAYFNQGLALAYGFNHAEAARSFYYATKLDPECSMCFFGYAYVLGPNYNAGMEEDNYERAYEAIQKAKSLGKNATKKEQEFINALAVRYVAEPPEDRMYLDVNYSKAMKDLFNQYPDDSEISTLYAESIMNLHPWDLYDKDGLAKEWTPEIVELLERLITMNPNHPGAHHFYIHATEASNEPELANESAKVFDDGLVPGSGHLLHMPSHTYIRTGEYHKGTVSNIAAVKADSTYVTLCHAQGAYPLAYYPHNYHFMAATATLEGNKKYAILGAKKVSDHVHPTIMQDPRWGTLQHYYTIPYYVAVKFGQWDSILKMDMPSYNLPYPLAIKSYAEGMAYLKTGNLEMAEKKLADIDSISGLAELKDITVWEINNVSDLVNISKKVLKAEILASGGKFEESISLFMEAISMEDTLNYNEPPDWFFSVRHHLGAIQLKASKFKEAIKTYNEDLAIYPKNGWALVGLKNAYEHLGKIQEKEKVEAQLKEAFAFADTPIEASTF